MGGWTIHIEAAGDQHAGLDDDCIAAFGHNLEDRGGSISATTDGRRYGATFSIDDPHHDLDAAAAIERGCEIFEKAAYLSGLAGRPIVRAEALTYAEHDADLARPLIPELVGIAEIADILGVNRQRASALQTRHDFPAPVAHLKMGPVWTRTSLANFADTWERKPGRPRKVPTVVQGRQPTDTTPAAGAAIAAARRTDRHA